MENFQPILYYNNKQSMENSTKEILTNNEIRFPNSNDLAIVSKKHERILRSWKKERGKLQVYVCWQRP